MVRSSLLLVAAISIISFSNQGIAASNLNNFSLTCDGNVRAIGNNGQKGVIVITAINNTPAGHVDEIWNISLNWLNSANLLLGAGMICEDQVPSNAQCEIRREGPIDLVTHFYISCRATEDGFDTRGLPHRVAEATLSLDSLRSHGFFYCRQNNHTDIELSNCR